MEIPLPGDDIIKTNKNDNEKLVILYCFVAKQEKYLYNGENGAKRGCSSTLGYYKTRGDAQKAIDHEKLDVKKVKKWHDYYIEELCCQTLSTLTMEEDLEIWVRLLNDQLK